jgi:HJR/Mrr/RecB family endonuclease
LEITKFEVGGVKDGLLSFLISGAEFVPALGIEGVQVCPAVSSWARAESPDLVINRLPLPDRADLNVHRIDVVPSKLGITRFAFEPIRDERGVSAPRAEGAPSQTRLPKVRSLDAPPDINRGSLEDRLRWILTPPVNQLVSDLTIPESPFAFQLQGVHWLMERRNALLADEMGLGKTMQAILAARLLWRQRKIENILIICPKSLIGNWKREIRKWWAEIADNISEPLADKLWFLRQSGPTVPLKLINYEALARDAVREALIREDIEHDLVIIDEAQRIKTASSKTSVAVKHLRGRYCWALSGTPLENRAEDLVSIMEFVRPECVRGIQPSAVGRAAKPYILRRRLDDPDVGMQLPPKVDQDVEVELTEAQRRNYDAAEKQRVMQLNAQGESVTVQHVFQLIRYLVQICNFDPSSGESAKMDRLIEDFEEVAESDKKAIVFSQFVSEAFGLKRVSRELTSHSHRVMELHGEITAANREPIIDRFNNSPAERALLVNYTVGGVGLNLQAAAYVFLFDRWWNPAVEDQAIKRAHRYGQKNRVIVRRFFCKNTIEERILSVLRKKRRLFRELIDDERPHEAMGLTEDELFSLFDLKVRPNRPAAPTSSKQIRLADIGPYDFEILVADLYRKQNFHVEHTGGSGDGGVDVLAERKTSTGVERYVIQCKHVSSPVGPEVLRSHWGVVSSDLSYNVGVVVTSSEFTADARAFARGKRLDLIDRQKLVELLRQWEVAEVRD